CASEKVFQIEQRTANALVLFLGEIGRERRHHENAEGLVGLPLGAFQSRVGIETRRAGDFAEAGVAPRFKNAGLGAAKTGNFVPEHRLKNGTGIELRMLPSVAILENAVSENERWD